MRITAVTLHHVAIPLHEPFRISNGSVAVKDAIVIELRTSSGIIGYGEASPMRGGFYSAETPESTWEILEKELIPAVMKLSDVTPESVNAMLDAYSREPFARAGLESAVWDALARSTEQPLYSLLGGTYRSVPAGVAIGLCDTSDELLENIRTFLAQGYVRVKIKIQPGWDVEPLAAIRAKFPDIPLMVDANASYTLGDHEGVLKELDRFNLMMIEQPLAKEAFEEAAELQRAIVTPICADESAYSLAAVEKLIAMGSARIINIKIQRVGGMRNARRIAERAMHAGLPCWLGTMPELGIASMQGIHLATYPAFTLPSDIHASARWFVDDIIHPPIAIDANGLLFPAPYSPNSTAIQKWEVRRADYSLECAGEPTPSK